MEQIYYLKCRKHYENKYPNILHTSNDKTMLSANCVVCNRKKIAKGFGEVKKKKQKDFVKYLMY